MKKVNLAPAQWIWSNFSKLPSNSMLLFEKRLPLILLEDLRLQIHAEATFQVFFNDYLVYRHTLISDPRNTEIANLMINKSLITEENNLLRIQVCWYGNFDSAWVPTKPGLIFKLTQGDRIIDFSNEQTLWTEDKRYLKIKTNNFLGKSLQEIVDLNCQENLNWKPSRLVSSWANQPTLAMPEFPKVNTLTSNLTNDAFLVIRNYHGFEWEEFALKQHSTNMLLTWNLDPEEWFDYSPKNVDPIKNKTSDLLDLSVPLRKDQSFVQTFRLSKPVYGQIKIEFETNQNAIVEIIQSENFDSQKSLIISDEKATWKRVIAKKGVNTFLAFLPAMTNWLQVNVRHANYFKLKKLVVLRQKMIFLQKPQFSFSNLEWKQNMESIINNTENQITPYILNHHYDNAQTIGLSILNSSLLAHLYDDYGIVLRYFETLLKGQTSNGTFSYAWPSGVDLLKSSLQKYNFEFDQSDIKRQCYLILEMDNFYQETNYLVYVKQNWLLPVVKFIKYLLSCKKTALFEFFTFINKHKKKDWEATLEINLLTVIILKIVKKWIINFQVESDFGWLKSELERMSLALKEQFFDQNLNIYLISQNNQYFINQNILGLQMFYDVANPDWNNIFEKVNSSEIQVYSEKCCELPLMFVLGMQKQNLHEQLLQIYKNKLNNQDCLYFNKTWWFILLNSFIGLKIHNYGASNISFYPWLDHLDDMSITLCFPHGKVLVEVKNKQFSAQVIEGNIDIRTNS